MAHCRPFGFCRNCFENCRARKALGRQSRPLDTWPRAPASGLELWLGDRVTDAFYALRCRCGLPIRGPP